uniref:Uncharacterized protein n=1 Tax=Romanomermis culicivorax TaxID=13658 RepID=A0A915HNS9_ROMCU
MDQRAENAKKISALSAGSMNKTYSYLTRTRTSSLRTFTIEHERQDGRMSANNNSGNMVEHHNSVSGLKISHYLECDIVENQYNANQYGLNAQTYSSEKSCLQLNTNTVVAVFNIPNSQAIATRQFSWRRNEKYLELGSKMSSANRNDERKDRLMKG